MNQLKKIKWNNIYRNNIIQLTAKYKFQFFLNNKNDSKLLLQTKFDKNNFSLLMNGHSKSNLVKL